MAFPELECFDSTIVSVNPRLSFDVEKAELVETSGCRSHSWTTFPSGAQSRWGWAAGVSCVQWLHRIATH